MATYRDIRQEAEKIASSSEGADVQCDGRATSARYNGAYEIWLGSTTFAGIPFVVAWIVVHARRKNKHN